MKEFKIIIPGDELKEIERDVRGGGTSGPNLTFVKANESKEKVSVEACEVLRMWPPADRRRGRLRGDAGEDGVVPELLHRGR